MNDDVPSRGNLRTVPPKDFADAPADPIAHHRVSQRLLYADAETASRPAVGAIKNHELRRRSPPRRCDRPPRSRRGVPDARRGRNPCGAPSEALDGREAMATLLAARRQDLAAPFGLHARAEAMRLMATAHFGLKGAFGQRCSSERPLISYPECAIQGRRTNSANSYQQNI